MKLDQKPTGAVVAAGAVEAVTVAGVAAVVVMAAAVAVTVAVVAVPVVVADTNNWKICDVMVAAGL